MKKTWSFVLAVALAISFLFTACANSSGESGAADLGVDNGETNEFDGKSVAEVNKYVTTPAEFVQAMTKAVANGLTPTTPSSSMKNVMDIPRSNNDTGTDIPVAADFFEDAFRGSRARMILEILKKETSVMEILDRSNGTIVKINKKISDMTEANKTLKSSGLWTLIQPSEITGARYWNKGSYVEMVFGFKEKIQYDQNTVVDSANDIFYVRVATRNSTVETEKSNVYVVFSCYDKSGKLTEQIQENLVVKSPGVRELRTYSKNNYEEIFDIVIADANTGNMAQKQTIKGGSRDGAYVTQYISGTDKKIYLDVSKNFDKNGEISWGYYMLPNKADAKTWPDDYTKVTKAGKKFISDIYYRRENSGVLTVGHDIPADRPLTLETLKTRDGNATDEDIKTYSTLIENSLKASSRLTSFTQGYVTAIESSRFLFNLE